MLRVAAGGAETKKTAAVVNNNPGAKYLPLQARLIHPSHSSLDIILRYYHVSEDELLGAVDGVNFAAVLGAVGDEESRDEK